MRTLLYQIILCLCVFNMEAQDNAVSEYKWLRDLVDSIENKTTLCSTCQTPPEIKAYQTPQGEKRFRLLIICSTTSSLTRFYDDQGSVVGACGQDVAGSSCDNFGETTSFTFGDQISQVWACDVGYNCDDIRRFDLFQPYDVIIAGDPCGNPVRALSVSETFEEYNWTLPDASIIESQEMIAEESGDYQLIVTDANGCLDTSMFRVDVASAFVPEIIGHNIICDDDGVELSLPGYSSYRWSDGTTGASTVVYDGGVITVIVANELGCEDEARIEVLDYRDSAVRINTSSDEIYTGQLIELTLDISNFSSDEIRNIEWYINSIKENAENVSHSFAITEVSTVQVSVTSEWGCVYTDELSIEPLPFSTAYYAPNVFNPNSNMGNDRFYIQGLDGTIKIKQLNIYNRYGMPVYSEDRLELNDYERGWQGRINNRPAPIGSYVYTAELLYANGTTEHVNGSILLIF